MGLMAAINFPLLLLIRFWLPVLFKRKVEQRQVTPEVLCWVMCLLLEGYFKMAAAAETISTD